MLLLLMVHMQNHYTEPYYFFLVLSLSKFIFLAVQDIFLSVILLQFVAFEQPVGILCWMLAFGDPDFAINYHKLLIVPHMEVPNHCSLLGHQPSRMGPKLGSNLLVPHLIQQNSPATQSSQRAQSAHLIGVNPPRNKIIFNSLNNRPTPHLDSF